MPAERAYGVPLADEGALIVDGQRWGGGGSDRNECRHQHRDGGRE